jgi:hypothetical protein
VRRTARSLVVAILGALVVMLALEALLRLLPVPTATRSGYYVDPMILSYPPHHRWQVATGWDLRNPQHMTANNFGFAAEHEFTAGSDAVALVGDSYVEASMLPMSARPAAQLERALGGERKVYAMGGPGSSLLDYAERARFARSVLGLRDVVILVEAGDARQALCDSGNVHAACLDRETFQPRTQRRPEPDVVRRALSHSAVAQYFAGQLRVSPALLIKSTFRHQVPSDAPVAGQVTPVGRVPAVTTLPFVDAVAQAFAERVARSGSGRTVLVMDGRRSPKAALSPALAAERAQIMQSLARHGLLVVDLEPVFVEHAARSSRSLDVGPYDGHLNEWGARLAMNAAAAALRTAP